MHRMTSGPDQPDRPSGPIRRLGPIEVLLFAAWCGLAAGELEVALRFVRRALSTTDRMFLMTRHFVWLVPVINLSLFLGFGVLCALATRSWPRRAGWLCPRLVVAWAVLPSLLLCGRGIHAVAWLVFAMGIAVWIAPIIERRRAGMRRWLPWTSAALLAAVAIQGGWIFGADALKRRREHARPSPAADPPNVLLVVMDTVRADHLSVYGYERPTSPHLEGLARRSVRFNQARAATPWTLGSHATMFTGRWPHELDARWMFPMRGDVPTLAEYLGSLGYATVGSVGNTFYCSYDSGLDRGFTEYRDYVLDPIEAFRTVYLVNLVLDALAPLEPTLDRWLSIGLGGVMQDRSIRQLTHVDRKDAGIVNRELLDWLDRRREPRRPFFAFLNYVDAHAPYVLPSGADYRFGSGPVTDADYLFLIELWLRVDKSRLTRRAQDLGRDCYDSCVAYVDEQIGALFDELRRRGVLERTIVIVTADHGEGLGEHGLFDHGESLYRTEIRVPLLISLPSGGAAGTVVDPFVSLRDIPATIAELVSPGTKPPFPGRSLAGLLHGPAASAGEAIVLSELAAPNPSDPNHGRSPAWRGPLLSLAEADYVYIRNEGDGKEELFNERDDPRELIDRSRAGPSAGVLQRFRDHLRQLTGDRGASPR
jgi:arylsulfatase A-like enzyme